MTDDDRPLSICPHLAAKAHSFHTWFTGRGIDHHWVCDRCALYPELPAGMIPCTDALYERCRDEVPWDGICGRAEIKQRLSSLTFQHEEFPLSSPDGERWVDVQPSPNSDGEWLVLLASGALALIAPRRGESQVLHRLSDLGFQIDDQTALRVSARGDYAAIYQTANRWDTAKRLAGVVDLRTGAVTARIDRGDHHSDVSYFPIGFFESAGRSLLVAATDWNRLDISTPPREPCSVHAAPPRTKTTRSDRRITSIFSMGSSWCRRTETGSSTMDGFGNLGES